MAWIFSLVFMVGSLVKAECFPSNNQYIPMTVLDSGISQASFNHAIDLVYNHYEPIVRNKGRELIFNRLWENGTVNSVTYVSGKKWIINSYGGLARHKHMISSEVYAAVACHELGHHMGGAPKYSDADWASTEGESDYWATKDCLKAIGFNPGQIRAASIGLANVLADLGRENLPSASLIDPTVVQKTQEDHPKAQCRLDTYLMGLYCQIQGDMSASDPKVNSCFYYPDLNTYGMGSRPRCWFVP